MDMDKEYYKACMGMEALPMSPAGFSAVTTEVTMAVATASEDEGDLKRGPWTAEEDMLLVDYISKHGEGRWNSLARCAGLRRTGKSCRLRWLNYLRPDVRRGNITPEEQLLILDLHSRWGNRWSKIAQRLPGRTDNEVKNYWRTRVQKHAKQLHCDVNSDRFRDVVRQVWMPRLLERIQAESSSAAAAAAGVGVPALTRAMSSPAGASQYHYHCVDHASSGEPSRKVAVTMSPDTSSTLRSSLSPAETSHGAHFPAWGAATATANVDGSMMQCAGREGGAIGGDQYVIHGDSLSGSWSELLAATDIPDFEFGNFDDNLWSLEDIYC
ncbi:unnamed protein product [Triticum turgidum subsp. durum]|uniref:Uncharacterized protein n=1 Tax=Triticum turgidum subsp. durum TaxID=4567 RepID=A0A9R0V6D2_TRITD|nr:unnamed protein product [Triticum turgidum subsp. durum]